VVIFKGSAMSKLLTFLESAGVPLIVTLVFVALFFVLHLVLRWRYKEEHKKTLLSQLLFFALAVIAVVSIVVSMPINTTLRAQILGLFGILLSAAIALSSTTLLGNALAGLMMRGVRNFRLGDFVELAGNFGRVTERGLFHIEIQTANRNLVTLPNMIMVTNPLEVYQPSGTMITTRVSLGYDTGHEMIKGLLIEAAQKAGLHDPFVHILELGDFSVLYKVSGLLEQTENLLSMRSKLNEEVLTTLHEASVEIVSPVFENQRNVQSQTFIPKIDKPVAVRDMMPQAEKSAFDKADKASNLAAREEELAANEARVSRLKEELDAVQNDQQKSKLEKEIAQLQKNQETIAGEIRSLSEKLETDGATPSA
jgi:small-conductance mechanosensitive channel